MGVLQPSRYALWAGSHLQSLLNSLSDTKTVHIPAFSGLRAMGVSGNRPLSIIIFLLSMVSFAVNIVSVQHYPCSCYFQTKEKQSAVPGIGGIVLPFIGCVYTVAVTDEMAKQ